MTMARAEDWRSRGGYFSWRPAAEDAVPVEIFHVELGDPGAPVLVLIHGWPTSSIDWFDVADRLNSRFRVCALDFSGYGFSSKPQGGGTASGATRSSSSSTWRRCSAPTLA
jgi:pimeloyl-ACP methyl ester carboxylesterase